jgi:2-hydroxycyclohexanecarboxyl-CoA dehydrogenase
VTSTDDLHVNLSSPEDLHRVSAAAPLVDLRGKVVLLPGASGGIGREVAQVMSDCGAILALTYHSRREVARAAYDNIVRSGGRARLDQLDTTRVETVKDWVASVLREFGHVDVLASCVGAHLPEGFSPFMEQDPGRWKAVMDAQLMSFLFLAHAVLPQMVQRKHGRLLTIASDSGKVGESGVAVGSAAHGGLIAFAKSLAREVGRHGITANVVCPGPTEGATIDHLRTVGNTGSRMVEEMIRRMPMKRLGTAREVASVMAFLASPAASFVNGQAISVSGGLVMN